MPKTKARSIGANILTSMVQSGIESVVLEQRRRYAVAAQALNQYVGPLGWCECGHEEGQHGYTACDVEMFGCVAKGCECAMWEGKTRAYPRFLPTQASGRWSTTKPPVPNFPKQCLNPQCTYPKPHAALGDGCWEAGVVFRPDDGWYWLVWDKDAIEARVNAVLTEDDEMVEGFNNGLDLHTLYACRTFGLPVPPNLVDPHKSPECAEWRAAIAWSGKEDLRRRVQKVITFGTFYGPDQHAVLGAKGVEELGLPREELLERTRIYLSSKPLLAKAKEKYWSQFIANPVARTYWGRRLTAYTTYQEKEAWVKSVKLYHAGKGALKPSEGAKKLWSFMHQGFESDHLNQTIIAVKKRWPESRFVFNRHDSLTFAFPEHINPFPEIRGIDEIDTVWGNGMKMRFTSTWHTIDARGKKVGLG